MQHILPDVGELIFGTCAKVLITLHRYKRLSTNTARVAGRNMAGRKLSLETIEKICRSTRGLKRSAECKARLSDICRKSEARKLASLRLKGVPRSEELKSKLRIANLGKTHSEASKLKMSLSKIGRKSSHETVAKIIKGMSSPEVKLKLASRSRPVKCVETGMFFKSGKAAGDWCIEQGLTLNKEPRNMINKAVRTNSPMYGYHWRMHQQ